MNCLHARGEFAPFWRRTMPLIERARLVEHLKTCARCDRAFRVFALSAPAVHSESHPEATASLARTPLKLARPQRFANGRSKSFARRIPPLPWQVAAAAALLMVGGFTVWSSIRWPARNFADSVAADTAEVEPASYSFDNNAAALDVAAQEPALFDSIAPEPSVPGDNGLAG